MSVLFIWDWNGTSGFNRMRIVHLLGLDKAQEEAERESLMRVVSVFDHT